MSACAVCDGAFFRNQDVIVVGGGDTAMEEAMYLSGLCKTRDARAPARGVPRQQDDAGARAREPEDQAGLQLGRRGGPRRVAAARSPARALRNLKTSETTVVPATGFFVAIGHTPNTDLFAGQLELHDNGYIKTRPGSSYTNVPGVFACGDVQDFTYRQAVTAAGTGCMAALDAERWMGANEVH